MLKAGDKLTFMEGNEPSMVDLIFTNEDYMIERLKSIAPLGKSDQVGLVWTFITYSAIDTRGKKGKDTITGKRIWQL